MGLSIIWLILTIKFILPIFGKSSKTEYKFLVERYFYLGKDTKSIIENILKNPRLVIDTFLYPVKLFTILLLFLPFCFISILGLDIVIFVFPLLFFYMIAARLEQSCLNMHYSAPFIPFIFLSAILGGKRLFKFIKKKHHIKKSILVSLLACGILSNFFFGYPPFLGGWNWENDLLDYNFKKHCKLWSFSFNLKDWKLTERELDSFMRQLKK
jgi:uncharacterized membrane protein